MNGTAGFQGAHNNEGWLHNDPVPDELAMRMLLDSGPTASNAMLGKEGNIPMLLTGIKLCLAIQRQHLSCIECCQLLGGRRGPPAFYSRLSLRQHGQRDIVKPNATCDSSVIGQK